MILEYTYFFFGLTLPSVVDPNTGKFNLDSNRIQGYDIR